MNKKSPYRASAGLTRDHIDRRITLRRSIRALCDVSEFKLKERGRFSEGEIEHVRDMLDELTVQLMEFVKIKETDGFFEETLTQTPERRHTVEQIMQDYDHLLIDLETMKGQLDSKHAPHVRRLLHGWLTRFLEMDVREVTLLQEVWNVDVGMMD